MKNKILSYIITIMAVITIIFLYNSLVYSTAKAETTGTESNPGTEIDPETEVDQETGIDPESEIDPGTGAVTVTPTVTPTPTPTPVATVLSITLKQTPSKTIYNKGDNLDLSDMILEGYYSDGTIGNITDYEITGYDSNIIGAQTVFVSCQGLYASFMVTVRPAMISNISVLSYSTTSITLTWDALPGTTRYEVYSLDALGSNVLEASTETNSVTFYYNPATVHEYMIRAIENVAGFEYTGELSSIFTAATAPEVVSGFIVTKTSVSSVSLTWNEVFGATGYIVYRSPAGKEDYTYCASTSSLDYTDKGLSSGVSYKYKVCAYTYDSAFSGEYSAIIDTSTNPAKMLLQYKAGDQKVRFTYSKVTGATYYDIYVGDELSGYTLLTSRKSSDSCIYTADNLTTGNTYSFYIVARRMYKEKSYESPASDLSNIKINPIEPTSTKGKYFATKAKFLNSWSYKLLDYFSKNVNYTKSVVIPGLITTDVGGFTCSTMCPQGITFAGKYLLQTAYDMNDEENSVIYVMNKKTKKLITTMILPSKTHAGGIAYDGVNLWIPTGKRISSIPFTQVEAAVAAGKPYANVTYSNTCLLSNTASFMTYYKDKLWIGTYNELEATNLYSYTIENKDTVPTLTLADTIVMPTRVQGISFTSKGTLILSRSCQLYVGLRGYMRQLDLYKPDFANPVNGVISLGELCNYVELPSMNEGIAIDGSYLYVTFESSAFADASYKMDRICAFKLTSLTKKAA